MWINWHIRPTCLQYPQKQSDHRWPALNRNARQLASTHPVPPEPMGKFPRPMAQCRISPCLTIAAYRYGLWIALYTIPKQMMQALISRIINLYSMPRFRNPLLLFLYHLPSTSVLPISRSRNMMLYE
jgi:hypothetical protein